MNKDISRKPKILIFDYETSPAKGYFFGSIWETNIIEIIEYEQILCVSWRWYGEKKTHVIGQDDFKGYKKGVLNDEQLVKYFAPIFDEADVVIGHNSDQFDIKVFNTRLLHWHMKPTLVNKSFDTKKISRNNLHLPSNKLDDIADFLGLERKLPHTGKNMWLGCEKGDKKDWKMMKKYCLRDSDIENAVAERLVPFMKSIKDFTDTERVTCPNPLCGSTHMIRRKNRIVKNGYKIQYQCMDCGSYRSDTKTLKIEDIR